ncbi:MAG TPA: hypothetical protein VG733_15930 [Chthoniobacteraceae bacterium]|nr:hypothetical protein [Chthoniobacteraceae bacterium]
MRVEPQYSHNPNHMDHVWLTIGVGLGVELRAALNTLSRRNRDAGFEPRIRMGVQRSVYENLPEPGVFECRVLDYGVVERQANVFYEYFDQNQMETLLVEKANRAVMVEVWGEIYAHNHIGIHQIHSRRTSCAVEQDIIGRDGAVKFHYVEDHASELLLFKFCGQP